jgi:hypothetical protein
LITQLNVVFFAAEVFRVIDIDVADYGEKYESNIIPAVVVYVIEEHVCLSGEVFILALRVPAIIKGFRGLIRGRGTKKAVGIAESAYLRDTISPPKARKTWLRGNHIPLRFFIMLKL